ncbi:MAG: SDR family NAD(P)-dependent oxidoreductase [Pirellulaceae bacterium]
MPELKDLFGTDHPVAIVTGSGAKRVGNAVARALAARGFHLVLHANRSHAEAEETMAELHRAGGQAIALAADLTDEAAARQFVDNAHQHYGRLDVLVNCAAIWKPIRLEDVTADDVRKNFEINTLATFLCSQQAGLKMAAQPTGGVIINIGDWAVARPYLNYAAYFPSKGAIPTLTRDLAVELAARNPRVRVNAILPGPVMLPPDLPREDREASIAGTLVKREGSPEHIAHAVLFLIENDFVTGVSLPVDGGRTIAS